MELAMSLAGQVALITGAATGIGRACALALAGQGVHIVVNYSKSEQEARQTAAEIEQRGVRALVHRCDVSVEAEVRAMVQRTIDEFGRLDILINNAGYTQFIRHADLEALTEEVWDRTFAVNVKGTWFCSRYAAPHMLRQGRGCIINIASIAGLGMVGSSIAYGACKAAVINLTRSLARVLGPAVRVNAVAPGVTDTRWIAGQRQHLESAIAMTPMKRIATPEDVAEVVLGLITSADFITGQTILVDGGRTLVW
jgi:3-oxoacyl-[acyl-carrier protein] reductase